MSVTDTEMRAKYADSTIQFLRLEEAREMALIEKRVPLITRNVMIMQSLTKKERSLITAKRSLPAAEKSIHYTFQFLKRLGMLKSSKRGYWGLTKCGRESRLSQEDYIREYKRLHPFKKKSA